MYNQFKTALITVLFTVFFISCKKDSETKDDQPQPSSNGSINVRFKAMVVNDTFAFNNNYVNSAGDTFSVNMLKYYVSNITLTNSDDSQVSVPGSYFLVDHNTFMEDEFTLNGIPIGSYKKISFLLGVDSAANVSGAQAGDLDPAKGMFWDWNSGYIMSRLEGYSPASTAIGKKIIFHVGGFTKPNLSLKNIAIDFNGTNVSVSQSNKPKITIKTDVSEWFKSPNTISFSTLNTVMVPGASSNSIADNYQDAFTLYSIQN